MRIEVVHHVEDFFDDVVDVGLAEVVAVGAIGRAVVFGSHGLRREVKVLVAVLLYENLIEHKCAGATADVFVYDEQSVGFGQRLSDKVLGVKWK